jgi:calmodulin
VSLSWSYTGSGLWSTAPDIMGCVGSVAVEQKEEPAISPEEEELLREEATARFKIVDKDGSGSLDRDEVASLSQILGLKLSPPELDAAMVQMDADGSGEVDLDEFVAWWVARKKTPSTALRSEALAMFKSVDDDGSGSLGRSEVEKLASMLGFSFAAGELDAVMLHACGSSDGEVNSEQFFDWWASPSSPREALAMFNTVDEDRSGLLDAGELKTLTRMFGVELTDEELEMAMLQIDNDGSGEVDFDEFYVWWKAGGPEQAAAWALHDEAGNDTNAAQRELREKEKRRKQQRARIAAAKAAARKREEDMLGGLGDEELRQPELDGASAHDKKPKRKNRGVCCCWEKKISNREQARDLFDQVDDDGSGLLDMEEIAKLAELLGATLKQSELEDAMRVMDAVHTLARFACHWAELTEGAN